MSYLGYLSLLRLYLTPQLLIRILVTQVNELNFLHSLNFLAFTPELSQLPFQLFIFQLEQTNFCRNPNKVVGSLLQLTSQGVDHQQVVLLVLLLFDFLFKLSNPFCECIDFALFRLDGL